MPLPFGSPKMNTFEGDAGATTLTTAGQTVALARPLPSKVVVGICSEHIEVGNHGGLTLAATVKVIVNLGHEYLVLPQPFLARSPCGSPTALTVRRMGRT